MTAQDALVARGEAAMHAGEFRRAMTCYADAASAEPSNATWWLAAARAAQQAGDQRSVQYLAGRALKLQLCPADRAAAEALLETAKEPQS